MWARQWLSTSQKWKLSLETILVGALIWTRNLRNCEKIIFCWWSYPQSMVIYFMAACEDQSIHCLQFSPFILFWTYSFFFHHSTNSLSSISPWSSIYKSLFSVLIIWQNTHHWNWWFPDCTLSMFFLYFTGLPFLVFFSYSFWPPWPL